MEAADFREVLCADVAVALGVLDATSAAAALARRLESGTGSVLDAAPEADRGRVRAEVERVLAEANGDVRAAIARRGVDRAIPASLKPQASHALAEAGARIRAPLRPIDDHRYVGFLPIGEGGMGVVYLALDTELNRRVAFKMIRTGAKDPLGATPIAPDDELVTRFLQEAWVTGGLEHPGIVPVYELGRTPSGVPYYTMRLVRGERTLDDAISEAKTLEDRLSLLEPFLKVCDAVRYAHSRGVVHRDLKPANVALGQFGEVVVLDWGLAKVEARPDAAESQWRSRIDDLRKNTDLRTLTSALGTPGYMAPEAALGQVRDVDSRSDVYSLGAMLYRILVGKLPFEMTSFGEYFRQLLEGVAAVPGAPSGLEPICLKALAVKSEDRYADADELATAIRKWQAESTVEREVRSLALEAQTAMGGAKDLRGEALLSQLDRVLAVSARILDLRPDHEGARWTRERALKAREAAIRERERLARREQLKRVSVVGLAVAVVAAVAVTLVFDAKRRESEQARAEATKERDAKARALDEVLRLADSKKVADLLLEEDSLWPVHPDRAAAMTGWIERAKEVLRNRAGHEAALKAVREQALPYTEADRLRELAMVQEMVDGDELLRHAAYKLPNDERRAALAVLDERTTWTFRVPEDDWRHQVLAELLRGLDRLAATLQKVEARHEAASTLHERSIGVHGKEWGETIAAIAASPKYGRLKIVPQVGLLPLGPDPDSRLFEFAHVGSGAIPERDPDTKRLALGNDFAIVLVLVPGGTFRMGAQKADPMAPNFDPSADDNESPVHEVTLAPCFIAKFECTQAQWETMTGARPSQYAPGKQFGGVTLKNPVEQVSWEECSKWLRRWNLALPTEAQWEYACRAGTGTVWWCGREVSALGRVANIADAFCRANGGSASWTYTEEVDDGYVAHAPVGSFLSNAFGLCDIHGNVWEWCRDTWGRYEPQAATDPVREGAGNRIARGGSWINAASHARSARRRADEPSLRNAHLGVRPARPVSTE